MVGSSDEPNYPPTSRQALDRTPLLFPMILFTILLTSLIATGSVSARESAVCDQYVCTEKSAACHQYGCIGDPEPEEHAPVRRTGSTGAETPVVEPAPAVEGVALAKKNLGVRLPPPTAVYRGIEESVPANEQYAEEDKITPPPPFKPNPLTSKAEPVETEGKASLSSKSAGQSTDVEGPGNEGESGDVDEPDENPEEPLPGYLYEGNSCEESNCGLEDIEDQVECATYETASGKKVYGCSNPKTYDKKGCYEVTFYTEGGKPYSNLDTCSGEKPYAPPEPPSGNFDYWAPPDEGKNEFDYEQQNWDVCTNGKNRTDELCGLNNIPENWECMIFFETVHGTVRGCASTNDLNDYYGEPHPCSEKLRVYDEVGELIEIYDQCPKIEYVKEKCGETQCGTPAPKDWVCRKERWAWGKIYGGEKLTFVRCIDPEMYDYRSGGLKTDCELENKRKPIAAIYNEMGKKVETVPCDWVGTGGGMGAWAGMEADETDDLLNNSPPPTDPTIPRAPPSEERNGSSWHPTDSPAPTAHRPLATPSSLSPAPSGSMDYKASTLGGHGYPGNVRSASIKGVESGGQVAGAGALSAFAVLETSTSYSDERQEGEEAKAKNPLGPDSRKEATVTAAPTSRATESARPGQAILSVKHDRRREVVKTNPERVWGDKNYGQPRGWTGVIIPLGGVAAAGAVVALRRRFLG